MFSLILAFVIFPLKLVTSRHDTQANAWRNAIQNAKLYEGEAFKHGRDGTIKERNTYKDDPYPPRG